MQQKKMQKGEKEHSKQRETECWRELLRKVNVGSMNLKEKKKLAT